MTHHIEAARLDALHQLRLLDTPPTESFDRITRMASRIFDLPIAAVSLTDQDRQWFKSRVGVEHSCIPRDGAPCAAVAESTSLLVIEDLRTDSCFADSVLGRGGTRFYAGAPLVTKDGHGLGALCVLGMEPRKATKDELEALTDLAAMVMAQIELQHAFGRIDPVSGLPNRNQFRDDLDDLARDRPGDARFAVVVDLARDDQIGRIVRALGAERVDDLIQEAALALRHILGPDRTAYHVGNAQFAFVSSSAERDLSAYVDLLERSFAKLRASSSVRFVTNVAIGVMPFVLGEVRADDVLRAGATAAQDARGVDGAIAVYSPISDAAQRRQYVLVKDFADALEPGDQLRLVFQPRVDLNTNRCVGAEALLRWRHPRLGDIPPAEFIPIIEKTSLARPLTRWVLNAALDRLAGWRRAGHGTMVSVNVSAINLAEPDLVEYIRSALQGRELPSDSLELEITESAVMENPDQAIDTMRRLAAAGFRLAIDDFGTGHSSLAYLQRLPADVVKIDQSFVRDLNPEDAEGCTLLGAMVSLARRLGFRVVAEGVETNEAATIIRNSGCEEAQGYLFARPLASDVFEEWSAGWGCEGDGGGGDPVRPSYA